MYYYKAMIYRKLGDDQTAKALFKQGYLEASQAEIFANERSHIYSMLCLQELQK
jgi:hypothetical protein